MSTTVPGPSNEKVQLNCEYLGEEGDFLYHVNLFNGDHDTLYLVRANTLKEAIYATFALFPDINFVFEHQEGYEIGRFI